MIAGKVPVIAFLTRMKTFLAVIVACGCALTARAGDADSGRRTLVVRNVQAMAVTGTNIAQSVKRIGNTYDAPQAIHVIDRAHIEQSGASSVGQLLRRLPGIR